MLLEQTKNLIWSDACSGAFFIRNHPWSFDFLNKAWQLNGARHGFKWENGAFYELLIAQKDENATNKDFSFSIETYTKGDFMLHFAGREDRKEMMHKYNNFPTLI